MHSPPIALLALCAAAASAQEPPAAPAAAASGARVLAPVTAHRIALAGSMGRQALLIIDGGAPRALSVGATVRGVKLLSLEADTAVVEVEGQRHTLLLGATAQNLGDAPAPGSGRLITLASDSRGHFVATGQINGRGVTFLVDTGATLVAIGQAEAERLGIDYRTAPRIGLRTANGDAVGWRVSLATLRVGDVELYNVDAVVQPMPMPFVLLGNSFLSRFQMRRENDTMTLLRRF